MDSAGGLHGRNFPQNLQNPSHAAFRFNYDTAQILHLKNKLRKEVESTIEEADVKNVINSCEAIKQFHSLI